MTTNDDASSVMLNAGRYWIVNWTIVQKYGLEFAVLLAYLVSMQDYYKADKSKMFYQTSKSIYTYTTIEPRKQRELIKQMIDIGIVSKCVKGMPPKNHYYIDAVELYNYIQNLENS